MPIEPWGDTVLLIRASDLAILTDDLDDLLARLNTAEGAVDVIIDLESIDHVNSSNLAQFVVVHKKLSENEGRLRLVAANQGILEVLEVSQLNRVLHMRPDLPTALADLATS